MKTQTARPEMAAPPAEFAQRLSSTRRGARLARHLAVHQLDQWGFPYGSGTSDTVAALVAELAANAVIHGRVPGRDFLLRLSRAAESIRVEVSDTRGDRRPPPGAQPTPPAHDAETGRGLLLVAAYATRWGIAERDPIGKTVWCEFTVPGPARG